MTKPFASTRTSAFADPATAPGPLPAAVAAALLAAVGEVALVIGADGAVLDAAGEDAAGWAGRPWIDTVTVESRPKVEEMLAVARDGGSPRWRQVNHPATDGDLPVRYLTMPLGDGRTIAIGRDMREAAAMQQRLLQTQQSLERDYVRLRQAEARYRLLFDEAADPVLIVDPTTRRIREANPAADRLLQVADGALTGRLLDATVAAEARDALVGYLGAAEAADDVPALTVQLAGDGGEARLSARLFRQARDPMLIVRLDPLDAPVAAGESALALDVVERMPDAFVLVDAGLTVLTANTAFLDLAGLASVERAVGQPLASWLGRPGIDLDLIVEQLREHGAVRNVATVLRGPAGVTEEVEVAGVTAPADGGDCYGFVIRNVGRRLRPAPVQAVPRSVGQLTELVGRMSLKEIVRESTDMIERLCIEAALVYTADNRASAAEILGVSRQSLYSKLHRHGLGNLGGGEE